MSETHETTETTPPRVLSPEERHALATAPLPSITTHTPTTFHASRGAKPKAGSDVGDMIRLKS
jgi:hypothetical protein